MLENLKKALGEALDDEYKARATYRVVISKFGKIRPFVNILESDRTTYLGIALIISEI